MSNVNVILLEKIDNLGTIGDVVSVKPGFARNFLLPQSKAMRATDDNIAYFEKEKAAIEKVNAEKRKDAEKEAKKLEDLTVNLIRQASEGGQLYGAISARDISDAISENVDGLRVKRGQVRLNQSFKMIGLFSVEIVLHPEVIVPIKVNVARSEDEAEIQAKTGEALVLNPDETLEQKVNELTTEEDTSEEFLEESALKAKQAAEEAEAQAAAEEAKKAAEEKAAKEAKAAAEAEAETTEEETAETAEASEEIAEEASEEDKK